MTINVARAQPVRLWPEKYAVRQSPDASDAVGDH
jgi:hypothetical protein